MTSSEKTTTAVPETKSWNDQEDNTNKNKVSENNVKYAEWWVSNLAKKVSGVVYIVKHSDEKTHGKKIWAKNAVRVKLYNKLNGFMEEHSLYDVLTFLQINEKDKFLIDVTPDEKKQVNIVGTYFVASGIYEYIRKVWDESVKKEND